MGDYSKTVRTADYFIEKFSAISEERWCEGSMATEDGRRCAQGFCDPGTPFQGKTGHWWPEGGSERQELNTLFWFGLKYETVGDVNDGKVKRFKDATPKGRILAALNEIKAKGV